MSTNTPSNSKQKGLVQCSEMNNGHPTRPGDSGVAHSTSSSSSRTHSSTPSHPIAKHYHTAGHPSKHHHQHLQPPNGMSRPIPHTMSPVGSHRDEKDVLLNSSDFANSLHMDDDDINLYLVAEMMREKKRKTETEVSYREPYAIPSNNTSPKSSSRELSSRSSQQSVAIPSTSSAGSNRSGIYANHVSTTSGFISQSLASSSTSAVSSIQVKQRRSSYLSTTSAVAAAVATAQAPTTLPASSISSTTMTTALPSHLLQTQSNQSPSNSSLQRKRKMKENDVALSREMEKFSMEMDTTNPSGAAIAVTAPESHSTLMSDVIPAPDVHVQLHVTKDVEMESTDSEDIHIQFHDESGTPSPTLTTRSLQPVVRDITAGTVIPAPPATFMSLNRIKYGLARVLSFLDLKTIGLSMSVSTQFRDLAISPNADGQILWSHSSWFTSQRQGSKCLQRVNQTYGVQAEHADWIIPSNPPNSFILSHLEHLSFMADMISGDQPEKSSSVRKSDSQSSFGSNGLSMTSILTDAHFVLLPYFTSLRTLNLSYVGLRTSNSNPAAKLSCITMARIGLLPKLTTLILDHCTEWLDDLALACLRNQTHTQQMYLPRDQFKFLPPNSSLPHLRILSFDSCTKISPRGLEYLIGGGGVPNLFELNMSNCPKMVSTESMAAIRWNIPMLQVLNLSWCGGSTTIASSASVTSGSTFANPHVVVLPPSQSDALRPLFAMPSLTSLDLRGWSSLKDEQFIQLSKPSSTPGPILAALSLKECTSLTPYSLQHITSLQSLQAIDLSDCRGLVDGLLHLFGTKLPCLRSLIIWNASQITDRGVELLLYNGGSFDQWQQVHSPTTSMIGRLAPKSHALVYTLRCFRITSNPLLTPRTCTYLSHCEQMQELEFTDVNGLGDDGLRALCTYSNGARSNLSKTLITLHISRLGYGFTPVSGSYLSVFTALQELDLSWNDGFDDTALARLLPLNHSSYTHLTKLNLSRCPISDASWVVLGHHITRSGENIKLDVKYCPHLTAAGLNHFKRRYPRTQIEENLNEYAQTRPAPAVLQMTTLPLNLISTPPTVTQQPSNAISAPTLSPFSPRASTPPSSNRHRRQSSATPTSSNHPSHRISRSGGGGQAWAIEDQVVANEDEFNSEDEDGEDDDDEDSDGSDDSDESMSDEPKFITDHVEETATGEKWDVLD